MKITFLDGSVKEFNEGMSAIEIAASISPSLAKKTIFALVNDAPFDASRPIKEDAKLELKFKEDAFSVLNHSCAHLLAAAIKSMYPNACFGVGPAIEEGFYYDIAVDAKLTEADFASIEKKMHELANKDLKNERIEVSKEEALKLFKADKYKHL